MILTSGANTPEPPVALTLVAAAYNPAFPFIELEFDRAIDFSGMDGSKITVMDTASQHAKMAATSDVTVVNPKKIQVTMVNAGAMSGSGVKLTATAGSGIVAVDDGGTWDGVTDIALPFP
jgi:hypothetical protein